MIDEFWRQYQKNSFSHYYHEYERVYLQRCIRTLSITSYIITAAAIAWWGITLQYADLWSIIIVLSQIANNMKDQFNINKRVWALGIYLSKSAQELEKMTKCWRLILLGELIDEIILDRITWNDESLNNLEENYIRPFGAREYSKLIKRANIRANGELELKHGKGEIDV